MLFLLTGSSCSGKSTIAHALRDVPTLAVPNLSVHDSDEDGVPSNADTAWRQNNLRQWVLRARQSQTDILLTGQSPLAELVAVPEAQELRFAVCLLDVADEERRARLDHRDPQKWNAQQTEAFMGWAAWHRAHAANPTANLHVITDNAAPGMRWERLRQPLPQTVPVHSVPVIDTTHLSLDESAAKVRAWIEAERGHTT